MVALLGGDVDRGEMLRRTAAPGDKATVFTPMLLVCGFGLLLVMMAVALLMCRLCGDGLSDVRISMVAGGVVRGDEVEFCVVVTNKQANGGI